MEVEVKFQQDAPEAKPVKTYTGSVSKWPVGVYQNDEGEICIKWHNGDRLALYVWGDSASFEGVMDCTYTRISDNPNISAMTFAGSMNYPDGKPEGGAM